MKLRLYIIGGLIMALVGCSGVNIETYSENTPKLDLREYLDGKLEAWGTIEDWKGKVTDRFYVTIDANWNGNEGVLDEHFSFDDGRKEQRIWTVKYIDDNNFIGTAGDVIGEAKGQQYGNAVNLRYTLRVPLEGGKEIDLNMDDWMYLIDENVLINKTKMRKFGIKVGEVNIAFKKIK